MSFRLSLRYLPFRITALAITSNQKSKRHLKNFMLLMMISVQTYGLTNGTLSKEVNSLKVDCQETIFIPQEIEFKSIQFPLPPSTYIKNIYEGITVPYGLDQCVHTALVNADGTQLLRLFEREYEFNQSISGVHAAIIAMVSEEKIKENSSQEVVKSVVSQSRLPKTKASNTWRP